MSCWYHHQNQSSEVNTNNELCETSCLPNFKLCLHSKSTRNNKFSIALPRVRTKAAQNGFYYQGAMIYNSFTRDICMQENENLLLKRIHNFNF